MSGLDHGRLVACDAIFEGLVEIQRKGKSFKYLGVFDRVVKFSPGRQCGLSTWAVYRLLSDPLHETVVVFHDEDWKRNAVSSWRSLTGEDVPKNQAWERAIIRQEVYDFIERGQRQNLFRSSRLFIFDVIMNVQNFTGTMSSLSGELEHMPHADDTTFVILS